MLFSAIPSPGFYFKKMHKVKNALWVNNRFTFVSEPNRMLSTLIGGDNQMN